VLAGLSGHSSSRAIQSLPFPLLGLHPQRGREVQFIWIFCCLSLLRLMSYLPLLSFGPSTTVPGSAYLLTPPFGFRSASLALPTTCLLCPLLTSAPRSGRLSEPSVAEATRSRSPGVSSTAFRAQPPDLRFASLMDMDFAVSCPLVRRWRLVSGFCPSTRTFAPRFFQTPPRGGSPCVLASPSPPSGWPEDFHLQTAEHAQHTGFYPQYLRSDKAVYKR
jgi:hypothetical protein